MNKRNYLYTFFFSILISININGQERYQSKLTQGPSIQEILDSATLYVHTDYEKSFVFIEKGFRILGSDKSKRLTERQKLYELLGDIYFDLEQFDLALEKYIEGAGLTRNSSEGSSSNRTKSKSLSHKNNVILLKLAKTYIKLDELLDCKSVLNSVDRSSINNDDNLLMYFDIYGDYYIANLDLDSALKQYNNGLENATKYKSLPYEVIFDNKIAAIFDIKGDYKNAEIHFNNSLLNSRSNTIDKRALQIETNAGFYRKNIKLDKEISLRKKEVEKEETNPVTTMNAHFLQQQNFKIGDAYSVKKDYKKAIPYLEKSVNIAKRTLDLETAIKATKKLSSAYENIGNIDLAFDNYRKYVSLTEELYKSKEKEIKDAVSKFNSLAKKQKRIDVLELDRALYNSQVLIKNKNKDIVALDNRQQWNIIYMLVGGLLLSFLALFFFYKNNKQKKLNNNLLQLKALKSQMNPHFIFNALNSVNNYIALNDERKANKYLTDFSQLMRMVLEVSEKDIIPLQKEVDLLKLYLQLEYERFSDKFEYQFTIDENISLTKINIPPMLLQPYIENAIWHGMRYKKSKGEVSIYFEKIKEGVKITITDDGIGRKTSQQLKSKHQLKSKSKGMSNTQSRVKILNEMYGHWIKINISDLNDIGEGTVVEVLIKDL